jgi:hypothetical protein
VVLKTAYGRDLAAKEGVGVRETARAQQPVTTKAGEREEKQRAEEEQRTLSGRYGRGVQKDVPIV